MLILPAVNASEWTGPTGNSTYLLAGIRTALIDAGVGNPGHLDAVANALAGRPLDFVLVTHGHVDHVAGVPALLARWPGAVVRGGGAGAALEDGELIDCGDTRLRALHTPGHAPDHFCFFDTSTEDLFCGDLARRGGTIVIPASRGGDLDAYLASLRRVRELRPRRLLPAHGPVVEDPTVLLDEYLAHRAQRTAEVRAALDAGVTDVDAIVARLYPALSPRLVAAARETVLAHLRHLGVRS